MDGVSKGSFSQNSTDIEALWWLRHSGKASKAHSGFVELAVAEHYPIHAGVEEKAKSSLELLLLDLSFFRSQLSCKDAVDAFEKLKLNILAWPAEIKQEFFLQLGLSHLGAGSYTKAFDAFCQADLEAARPVTKILLQLNLIISMEGLGYNFGSQLEAVENQLSEVSFDLPTSVYEQLLAIKIRKAFFREADLSLLTKYSDREDLSDQSRYFIAWLESHPAYRLSKSSTLGIDEDIVSNGSHWLRAYRARTLGELSHDSDFQSEVRLEAQVERLYLWTWKWLVDPKSERVRNLAKTLQSIADLDFDQEITPYSYKMLENSLSWLSLFQWLPLGHYDALLSRARPTHKQDCPFLDYEQGLIEYYGSLRSGESRMIEKQLQSLEERGFKLNRSDFLMPKILISAEPMAELGSALRSTCEVPEKLEEGVLIDNGTNEVSVFSSGELTIRQRSSSLCRLLSLFSKAEVQSRSGVFHACFGFYFDGTPEHEQKVRNLIARANRILAPFGKIKSVNSSHLHFTGEPSALVSYRDSAHRIQMDQFSEIKISGTTKKSRVEKPEINIEEVWLKRQTIESLSGLSKSTLNRRLSQMSKNGLIERSGTGKATRYRLLVEEDIFMTELRR